MKEIPYRMSQMIYPYILWKKVITLNAIQVDFNKK